MVKGDAVVVMAGVEAMSMARPVYFVGLVGDVVLPEPGHVTRDDDMCCPGLAISLRPTPNIGPRVAPTRPRSKAREARIDEMLTQLQPDSTIHRAV